MFQQITYSLTKKKYIFNTFPDCSSCCCLLIDKRLYSCNKQKQKKKTEQNNEVQSNSKHCLINVPVRQHSYL